MSRFRFCSIKRITSNWGKIMPKSKIPHTYWQNDKFREYFLVQTLYRTILFRKSVCLYYLTNIHSTLQNRAIPIIYSCFLLKKYPFLIQYISFIHFSKLNLHHRTTCLSIIKKNQAQELQV